jgi:glycyl-tRNA synthetase alpha chain
MSLTLQGIVSTLNAFWEKQGSLLHFPWDAPVGAGTMHPETFLRVLGPDPWRVAYVQPSRRPTDGRYGENPNRLYKHHQYQVILKPAPADVQDLYLESLRALGIEPADHDVRFEEDNWESPALGAWGIGWQVLLDGQEITQFTYFQQAGGINLSPISAEITYGIERIAMYLQDKESIFDVEWAKGVPYGRVRLEEEYQLSRYSFELADLELHSGAFDRALAEAKRLLDTAAPRVSLAAYDWVLQASHAFNVLDARGGISVTQRAAMLLQIRKLACAVAAAYVEERWPAPKAEAEGAAEGKPAKGKEAKRG